MTTESNPADSTSTSITEQPAAAPPLPPACAPPAPQDAPAAVEKVPTWTLKADVAILLLVLLLSFFLASYAATNSDFWLHMAIGKRLSEANFEFGVDPFSWATEGVYWVHHSWLFSW